MAITDELREFASHCAGGMGGDALRDIADRIDREHQSACAEAYGNGVMSVPIALDESQWVKLPVDADGVPIRPGDELVIFETGEHIRAYDVELYDDGRWLVCDDETMDSIHPDRLRHRAQTVEDVLRECIANVCRSNAQLYQQGCSPLTMEDIDEELDEYINEYAAKLRLAEEVDE